MNMRIATAQQMRETDRIAIQERGIPSTDLMERAAAAVAEEVMTLVGDCAGRVAACQLAPYPPGVPVVAPGERIGKKELSYLQEIGYNSQEVWVVAEG